MTICHAVCWIQHLLPCPQELECRFAPLSHCVGRTLIVPFHCSDALGVARAPRVCTCWLHLLRMRKRNQVSFIFSFHKEGGVRFEGVSAGEVAYLYQCGESPLVRSIRGCPHPELGGLLQDVRGRFWPCFRSLLFPWCTSLISRWVSFQHWRLESFRFWSSRCLEMTHKMLVACCPRNRARLWRNLTSTASAIHDGFSGLCHCGLE